MYQGEEHPKEKRKDKKPHQAQQPYEKARM
ncbi:hypothetical protein CAPGI0001_1454 [Capnocytophaga gingivalis ATCC 33624]|nr:hypothetical protein CAPGI0001_1454 [Capnocytophaga gingivalis ATCC 33624]